MQLLRTKKLKTALFDVLFSLVATCAAYGSTTLNVAPTGVPNQLRVSGSVDQTMVLQSSSDFVNWTPIQTNLAGSSVNLVQTSSTTSPRKFYRWRPILAQNPTPAPTLPDLGALVNNVFIPAEGFNTIQYAPNGKLGFIVWKGTDLIFRERGTDGVWRESVAARNGLAYRANPNGEEYRFQPAAALLYDSQSRAHVIRHTGGATFVRSLFSNNQWSDLAQINTGTSPVQIVASFGPNDKLHLAVANTSPAGIHYGTDKSGSWVWTRVANINGNPRGFLRQSYAPRWFSMAVDANNAAHITYTPEFKLGQTVEGYMRPYSQLWYASNASGNWGIQLVQDVADGSGEAAFGASIAIGPDNKPYIANWYCERAPTGSAQWSTLYFHSRTAAGGWSTSTIARNTDNYIGGDGERGAGFAPYLRFDASGVPHVIFSDHASQHFPYQNEFAGQIRHARRVNGQWITQTLYRQGTPLQKQMIYPAFAVRGNELAVIGLERSTTWLDYMTANSNYKLIFLTRTY